MEASASGTKKNGVVFENADPSMVAANQDSIDAVIATKTSATNDTITEVNMVDNQEEEQDDGIAEAKAKRNLEAVKKDLHDLYNFYAASHSSQQNSTPNKDIGSSSSCNILGNDKCKTKSRSEFDIWAQGMDIISPLKSDLDAYLEEGRLICNANEPFDALQWWRANTLKFRVLSKMAKDILSIPVTTVASESTFSVGGRVLDQYRSSLKPETVQALICASDWLRCDYKLGQSAAATTIDDEDGA